MMVAGSNILTKPQLESRLNSLDTWAAIFTFLVVVGVGGELITHIFSSRANKALINLQNDEEKTLQAEVARLGNATAEANKAMAQANERANQMELQTEELRNQNLELQRRINPRFLTTVEQQTIFDSISPFKGHPAIITRLGDGEAGPYGDSIIGVFQKAGWIIQINQDAYYSPPTYGLLCRISPHPDKAVEEVLAAFKKAKLDVTIQQVPAAQQDSWLDILVGLKPIN